MAKNSNYQTNKKKEAKKRGLSEKSKKLLIIIIAAVVALSLIAAVAIGIIASANDGKWIDYMNDDLSKYISIDEDDYKNFPVTTPLLPAPTEADVIREVNKLLTAHKSDEPEFNGAAMLGEVLTIGDVLNLWYSGYVIEDGVRKEIANTSNYTSTEAHKLELGAGTFIPSLEDALIGLQLQPTPFEKIKDGTVTIAADDVIYLSYSAFHPDGSYTTQRSERIDLGADYIDTLYGAGFRDMFVGKNVTFGEEFSSAFTCRIPGEEVDTGYYKVSIDFITRCEDKALTIPVTFPLDYSEKSLRGKTVLFDVFAYSAVIYETPEWTDSFITETLKLSADELAEYAGETLTERYESRIMKELTESTDEANSRLIEEDMWAHYKSKVNVKRLPENEVTEVYQQYYDEALAYYQYYSSSYGTVDAAARAYFGLSSNDDWREYITERAEDVIIEKLIFYYILQAENLIPSDEEYERIYNENIEEYFEYYKKLYENELAACKTDEEREAKLAEIKREMLEYYGEEYFEENAYYQYAIYIMISYAATEAQAEKKARVHI